MTNVLSLPPFVLSFVVVEEEEEEEEEETYLSNSVFKADLVNFSS
jgi:hypothetical protein